VSPGYDEPKGCGRITLFLFGVILLIIVIIFATWPR
jgi:hypothetical protein